MRGLTGKRALVTGAATGIGAAVVKRLVEEGASVVAADLSTATWDIDTNPNPEAVQRSVLDVSLEDDWVREINRMDTEELGLDILVNNAALTSPATLEDETMDKWQLVTAVGQQGTWLGMKHAGPLMARSGGGAIVNVGSIYGVTGGFGTHFAYHAIKGAVSSMTRNAALHFADKKVRVNAVLPGFIDTPATRLRPSRQAMRERMVDGAPMQRMGTQDEVAGAIAYLASEDASFITGSELRVDGGWTA
jgi:NAD(P)-dependent dehydrogenase (short-subunit alcohol dehydrogenase family)